MGGGHAGQFSGVFTGPWHDHRVTVGDRGGPRRDQPLPYPYRAVAGVHADHRATSRQNVQTGAELVPGGDAHLITEVAAGGRGHLAWVDIKIDRPTFVKHGESLAERGAWHVSPTDIQQPGD